LCKPPERFFTFVQNDRVLREGKGLCHWGERKRLPDVESL